MPAVRPLRMRHCLRLVPQPAKCSASRSWQRQMASRCCSGRRLTGRQRTRHRRSKEAIPLPLPFDRERLQKLRQPGRRLTVEDPLDDIGGEECEAQERQTYDRLIHSAAASSASVPYSPLSSIRWQRRARQHFDERTVDLRQSSQPGGATCSSTRRAGATPPRSDPVAPTVEISFSDCRPVAAALNLIGQ
jgi:hypothetical protein